MKVLVIGGTRFIGSFVVHQLVEQGHQVFVFHRGETNQNLPQDVTHITGDRKNLDQYREEFQRIQPDAVLDMIPFTEEEARLLLQTFRGITNRIVLISSADVYAAYGRLIGFEEGDVVPSPMTETSLLRTNLYTRRTPDSKPGEFDFEYEKIVIENLLINNGEIPYTILRLPMVHGPFDRQHRVGMYLKRMADERPYILLEEGQADWMTCRGYVENVAHAIVLAITTEKAANNVYNVADEPITREIEWVKDIQKNYANWIGEVKTIPSGTFPSPLNFHQHLTLDTSKIREELGFKEIVSPDEGLRRSIEWELTSGLKDIDSSMFNYGEEDQAFEKLVQEKR